MEDFYIIKKEVDRSVLCQGFSIPATFQSLLFEKIGFKLNMGEQADVTVSMNNANYTAKLKNQNFDRNKYTNHTEVVQIRYDSNKMLLQALRAIFCKTWDMLANYYEEYGTYKGFKVNPEDKEYIIIYATPLKGTLVFDCLSQEAYTKEKTFISSVSELDFENMTDEKASMVTTTGIKKIRRLSKSIGNSLKVMYNYKCQICGQYIGEKYDSNIIHAHHIDYFTKSLNNNADNIMIVCPNHHYIIHDKNPLFDKNEKLYIYPNGYKEGLKINLHI